MLFIYFFINLLVTPQGMWDLIPWPGIEPGPPEWAAWSLNHWATMEILCFILKTPTQHSASVIHLDTKRQETCLSIWTKPEHSKLLFTPREGTWQNHDLIPSENILQNHTCVALWLNNSVSRICLLLCPEKTSTVWGHQLCEEAVFIRAEWKPLTRPSARSWLIITRSSTAPPLWRWSC